ncbi:alpha/beta fold hydrolase [Brevundimonas lutea]|uniref:alpha/beta fold hydrolase n=1 Tax=Brevundimonas lutea TaxID=2293980 RepID=UPI0013CE8B39|nr:alpha/beta hydrolase [Brevundimonas lutea]
MKRNTVVAGGVDLAWVEQGRGPPVVYLHGALTTLEEGWLGPLPDLATEHRVIAFDRPGHGLSGTAPGLGAVWRQAAVIRGAVRALDVVDPVLVGHSFGGAVALAYALQFPDEIRGVVGLAPIALPEARLETALFGVRSWPGSGPWINAMAAPVDAALLPILWRAMFLPQSMPDRFASDFPRDLAGGRSQLRADGEEALAMPMELSRSALAYGGARAPLIILQGERDAVVSPWRQGRMLAALWPRAEFRGLAGLGHMAHHFRPDAVIQAVEDLASGSLARRAERAPAFA